MVEKEAHRLLAPHNKLKVIYQSLRVKIFHVSLILSLFATRVCLMNQSAAWKRSDLQDPFPQLTSFNIIQHYPKKSNNVH